MGRKSVMIAFDPAAFRDLVKGHGKTLTDLETITGVTKQAINGWLSYAKIPPRQLHTIAQGLKWKSDEVARILKPNILKDILQDDKVQKFFRKFQNLSANDQAYIERQVELLNASKKK